MPRRRRSQLSKNSSQARLVKVRRIGESSSENADRLEIMRVYASQSRARELSVERSIRLAEQNARYERQSSAERSQRLEENRARNSRTRARESSTERSQRLLTQRDRQRSLRARTRNRILAHSNRSAFSYDPQIEYAHQNSIQIGAMNKMCEEAKGMCCASGKVVFSNIDEPPEPIKSVLTNNHILSAHFLNNVRRYNSLFQMTSFGAKEIKEGHFMPTFKVEGQVYHLIGSLLPPSGQIPQFLQIYFISDADQLSLRSNTAPMLKLNFINELQTMLNSHNVYIRSFKHSIELNTPDSLKLIIYSDRTPHTEHRGRYNAPSINEVAVLLVDEDKGPRDIVLHGRDGQLKRVSELHRAYDPLQYPLMFASGDDGYYLIIPQQNSSRNKTVSCMQYYAYRLMIRANCFNALHYYKDLFNQYCVDMMAKMISERLNFVYRNQQKLRADDYIHLRDALNQDARVIAANIGQHVILPSSFTGSPRYLHEKTQDAMTYVRNYGRPDLFITFTCNPDWQEIKQELFPGQRSFDRHDIIARVFHLKMKKMIKILTKDAIFGPVKCYMLTVEWQKRGLPHCHMLLWLNSKVEPDEIDKIIVAELPNKDEDPVLFEIVTKNMVHGPCGQENLTSPCMKNGICTKKYPRRFVTETQTGEDGYPVYRRRDVDNGRQIAALNVRGRTVNIDNRWIVPYSPILCRSFNAHINVEYCHSVQAIKYICKYINKGSDQATFSVRNAHDEVENYLNGRRKRGQEVVGHPGIKKDAALGRVYSVHPSQSDCFYLRILLHHVRGPTSFQDLKTVDGVVKETYQAACREWGLLEDDNQWETTLREASISQCPLRLRELFVVILLLFCFPSEPLKLWDTFKDDLCEDIRHIAQEQGSDYDVYNKGLIQIENKLLELNDKSLRDFGLPSPNRSQNVVDAIPCRIYDVNELSEFVNSNVPKLVADQKIAYDAIIESVENNSGQLFFLDVPGGTGKTFLANLVLSKVRLSGRKALAVASSGIAATLLYDGKTAHSTFKLPLTVSLDQQSVCSIRKNGPLGKLLQDTSLIIWDECTMSHRAHVEAVDRTLKDIRNSCNMMGGVTFVFAGDFRQTLPVVTKGTRADVIKACLKSSPLWLSIKTLNLRTNMRAHLCNNRGGNFSENILKLGDGKFTTPIANSSQVLLDIGLAQTVHSLEILIDKIYPDINNLTDSDFTS
ncbi:uncharacterized protein LOC129950708 [Eupeodes corollae]|uniref:uncharacterized protein LOC129950708 n=1 Tax=Eupeodes corollae TaxID=290404 RepID=UPI00249160B0|nr:uncharacterized protein LOC129950708 [Eupeodes corollae]